MQKDEIDSILAMIRETLELQGARIAKFGGGRLKLEIEIHADQPVRIGKLGKSLTFKTETVCGTPLPGEDTMIL